MKNAQRSLGKHPAHSQLRHQRMQVGKAGIGSDQLGHFRIVFHRARTKRVEIAVHTEIATRQFGKVPHDVKLTELGQTGRLSP